MLGKWNWRNAGTGTEMETEMEMEMETEGGMLASGSTDCQPNHHGLMELFDCLCCHHSFFINSLLEKKITIGSKKKKRNII